MRISMRYALHELGRRAGGEKSLARLQRRLVKRSLSLQALWVTVVHA